MKKKLAFLGAGSHADAIAPVIDPLVYDFVGFLMIKILRSMMVILFLENFMMCYLTLKMAQ